jgi:hypothetical protein
MPALSFLSSEAHAIASGSSSPEVKKLADIVCQLCRECEGFQQKAEDAWCEARNAGGN